MDLHFFFRVNSTQAPAVNVASSVRPIFNKCAVASSNEFASTSECGASGQSTIDCNLSRPSSSVESLIIVSVSGLNVMGSS
jgi:hypothetical protein